MLEALRDRHQQILYKTILQAAEHPFRILSQLGPICPRKPNFHNTSLLRDTPPLQVRLYHSRASYLRVLLSPTTSLLHNRSRFLPEFLLILPTPRPRWLNIVQRWRQAISPPIYRIRANPQTRIQIRTSDSAITIVSAQHLHLILPFHILSSRPREPKSIIHPLQSPTKNMSGKLPSKLDARHIPSHTLLSWPLYLLQQTSILPSPSASRNCNILTLLPLRLTSQLHLLRLLCERRRHLDPTIAVNGRRFRTTSFLKLSIRQG